MGEENDHRNMNAYFESRMTDIEKGYSEEAEEAGELLEPLDVSNYVVVKVMLCWGGPSDGFLLHKQGGEIVRGYYFYADWFFYEEKSLSGEETQMVQDYFGIH